MPRKSLWRIQHVGRAMPRPPPAVAAPRNLKLLSRCRVPLEAPQAVGVVRQQKASTTVETQWNPACEAAVLRQSESSAPAHDMLSASANALIHSTTGLNGRETEPQSEPSAAPRVR